MAVKTSRNEQRCVIRFLRARGLTANAIHTHHTVQTWPPVTIIFMVH